MRALNTGNITNNWTFARLYLPTHYLYTRRHISGSYYGGRLQRKTPTPYPNPWPSPSNPFETLAQFGIPTHPPDYDLATCSHQHTILATATISKDDTDPVPVTLY